MVRMDDTAIVSETPVSDGTYDLRFLSTFLLLIYITGSSMHTLHQK